MDILVCFSKRHTVVYDQPPQVYPEDPQLLLAELLDPEGETLKEATMESFFCVFSLSHFGHIWVLLASENRTINSNTSPHSLH
jgi:hypothetical protein